MYYVDKVEEVETVYFNVVRWLGCNLWAIYWPISIDQELWELMGSEGLSLLPPSVT